MLLKVMEETNLLPWERIKVQELHWLGGHLNVIGEKINDRVVKQITCNQLLIIVIITFKKTTQKTDVFPSKMKSPRRLGIKMYSQIQTHVLAFTNTLNDILNILCDSEEKGPLYMH